jgi:PBP1b-binding outer membrane lipoprotein LpoB
MTTFWKCMGVLGAVILVAIVLAGCTNTPRPSKCPPVKEYDEEFTNRFRAQLDTIPEGSPVAVYILDAKDLRKKVRACQ